MGEKYSAPNLPDNKNIFRYESMPFYPRTEETCAKKKTKPHLSGALTPTKTVQSQQCTYSSEL